MTIFCFFVLSGLHLNLEALNQQNVLILEKSKILETYGNTLQMVLNQKELEHSLTSILRKVDSALIKDTVPVVTVFDFIIILSSILIKVYLF